MSDPFRLASSPLPGQPGLQGLAGEIQSEVSVEAAPLLLFVLRHIKTIVGLVLLFVAVIIGYGVWQWQTESALRDARLELGRVLGREGQAKVDGLEAFLASAPASLRTGALLSLGESALAVDDLERAAGAYRRIMDADPQGALGFAATVDLSGVLQRQNKFADAVPLLEGLVQRAPEALKIFALEELAMVAEQGGQVARAIAAYEELASTPMAQRTSMEQDYFRTKVKELKARAAAKPAS